MSNPHWDVAFNSSDTGTGSGITYVYVNGIGATEITTITASPYVSNLLYGNGLGVYAEHSNQINLTSIAGRGVSANVSLNLEVVLTWNPDGTGAPSPLSVTVSELITASANSPSFGGNYPPTQFNGSANNGLLGLISADYTVSRQTSRLRIFTSGTGVVRYSLPLMAAAFTMNTSSSDYEHSTIGGVFTAYQIRDIDNSYIALVPSPADPGTSGPPPPAPPPAPTSSGPPLNPCLGGTVPIQWTAVAGAATYSVLRNGIIIASGLTNPAYTDNTAQVGVYYAYTVTATNAGGTSAPSAPFNVIPCAIDSPPNPTPLPADGNTPWGNATPACDTAWSPATPGCDTIWGDSTATATDWTGGKSC